MDKKFFLCKAPFGLLMGSNVALYNLLNKNTDLLNTPLFAALIVVAIWCIIVDIVY